MTDTYVVSIFVPEMDPKVADINMDDLSSHYRLVVENLNCMNSSSVHNLAFHLSIQLICSYSQILKRHSYLIIIFPTIIIFNILTINYSLLDLILSMSY